MFCFCVCLIFPFFPTHANVALGARPRELLKVHNFLNNYSLLLASNGTTSRLLRQEEHALAVLVLARVDFLFVGSKVCVAHESGVLAQVTHQKASENEGPLKKSREACIIIIILDMIIIIVTITFIMIIVIIRGSSHYATCMPLSSDTFHHHIWGRRSCSCHLALDFATRVACWGNFVVVTSAWCTCVCCRGRATHGLHSVLSTGEPWGVMLGPARVSRCPG